MAVRNPELLEAAQLLRRTSFRVSHEEVVALSKKSRDEMLETVLAPFVDDTPVPEHEKSEDTIRWWQTKTIAPGSGLHEKMVFFWHTLLPTHRSSSGNQVLVARQLEFFRQNALGNYRTLLQGFVTDPALMFYLDARSSTAKNPNENLSRELMELFTFGIGNYTEADVKAGALAMTGWVVDGDKNWEVRLEPRRAYTGTVNYLGETKAWDLPQIVDRLVSDPRTAARISSKLWYYFIGTRLSPEGEQTLGNWWLEQDLEILPLVSRIIQDPAMVEQHYARPRSGYEFYAAFQTAVGLPLEGTHYARELSQGLYEPPNVGGWPDERWLTADSLLRRSHLVSSSDYSESEIALQAMDDEILDRCGMYQADDATILAVQRPAVDHSQVGDEGVARVRWQIVMSSPEFQLI